MGEEGINISLGTWKDNIRFVILDWRERSAGHSSEVGVRWSLKRRKRPVCHSSRLVSSSCVFSGRQTTSQKGSVPQKKDTWELSLTVFLLHTIFTVQKNNMNYTPIYLRGFPCLSRGTINDTIAIKLFFRALSERPCGGSIFQLRHDRCLEKTAFYFIGLVWFLYDR